MTVKMVDRATFMQNLRISKLLTQEQFRMIADKMKNVRESREIAKALCTWKLLTKFQAKMLLTGRNCGFFIGPYRILDVLGQGGMGRVYRAMHQTMHRLVALKILSPQLVKTPRARKLFQTEVQAAAQLSHPNIVMAYDANEFEGRHYLAMEFIDGPNLETYVHSNGTLPVGMACEMIFQAASGLQHAHERGMVHRDIKPANLLFQQEPGASTVQVKILDFGLARLSRPRAAQAGVGSTIIAHQDTIMGTPDFLSPEQARNLNEVDIRSDLYSLGCTFYFLLTGQPPFAGGPPMDKLLRHASEIPQPLEELRPDVPPVVSKIVMKLMAKSPADRFQQPDDLVEALAPYASPTVMNWPIRKTTKLDKATDEHGVLKTGESDTEPKAQSSTFISDEDSILEWVDINRRQRRRTRRWIAAGVCAFAGILALSVAGLLAWVMMR